MKNEFLRNLGINEDGFVVDEVDGMLNKSVRELVFYVRDGVRVEKEEGFKKLEEYWSRNGNENEDYEKYEKLVEEMEKLDGEWILWCVEYDFNLLCVIE